MFSLKSSHMDLLKDEGINEIVNSVNTTDTEDFNISPNLSATSTSLILEEENEEFIEIESPLEVKTKLPLTSEMEKKVIQNRKDVQDLLISRNHNKMLVILANQDDLDVVNYPNLNLTSIVNISNSDDIFNNRKRIIQSINKHHSLIGFISNNISINYYSDLFSLGILQNSFIESQTHREICSSLSFPIGLIPNTNNLTTCYDSIMSISKPHKYLNLNKVGQLSICQSSGNKDTFIILPFESQTTIESTKIVLQIKSTTNLDLLLSTIDTNENIIGVMIDENTLEINNILTQLNNKPKYFPNQFKQE